MPLKNEFKRKAEKIRVKIYDRDQLLTDETTKEIESPRCFIVTATLGTPIHPKLSYFRKFRDEKLLKSLLGKSLVQIYYKMSPPISSLISRSEYFKSVMRFLLNPIADYLKNKSSEP